MSKKMDTFFSMVQIILNTVIIVLLVQQLREDGNK